MAERVIVDDNVDYVSTMHDAAIAELVVRAVNAHAPLLAACKESYAMNTSQAEAMTTAEWGAWREKALAQVRAAIALAEVQP